MADNNILTYRKKWHMNIGIFLFGIIFLYLIAMVVLYLTANKTTSYEVRMGSLLNDTAYTGIALREETVVTAQQAGYVNYFSTENEKKRIGTNVYVTSQDEIVPESDANAQDDGGDSDLTADEQNSVGLLVQSFTDSFRDSSFADVYSFKDSIQNSLSGAVSDRKDNYLNELISSGSGVTASQAVDDGVIVYRYDGYESLTKEEVTEKLFNKTDYEPKEFYNNMKVSSGDPVYTLITSEEWMIAVPVTKETADALKDRNSVKVRFSRDNETMTAGLTIEEKDDGYMAYLSFQSGMVRYANERFIDLQLIIDDYTGLKIPKSAVTEKAFYVVPSDYISQGNNSSDKGVLRRSKDAQNTAEFISATVYYTEDNMAYLDPADFKDGDVLIKPDSNTTYVMKEKRNLTGVFNINKGYAVFKQIKILCESDDYYIVESGNDYGLSNYDHIALNSEKVKENDIITQ